MANTVLNTFMYVSDVDKFKEVAINSKNEVDFTKIVPCPDELYDTVATSHTNSEAMLGEVLVKQIREHVENKVERAKAIELVTKSDEYKRRLKKFSPDYDSLSVCVEGVYNYIKYGYYDWYDFCNANWGTKWNAYDQFTCIENIEHAEFFTAWNTPTAWLHELAKYIDFTLCFADENLGYNCGVIYAKNGVLNIEYLDKILSENYATAYSYIVRGYDIEEDMNLYSDYDNEEEVKRLEKVQQACIPVQKFYQSLIDVPFDSIKLMSLNLVGLSL